MEPEAKFPLDLAQVHEEERLGCSEFFQGKSSKTPSRYMHIRNHIVAEWQRTKPTYLTKIRARAGLKNCGDVNAIGRVHQFLEDSSVINVGAVRQRARRAEEAGGHTISHDVVVRRADDSYEDNSSSDTVPRKRRKARAKGRAAPSEFQLLPCHTFAQAPFLVEITAAALALMDLHAHLMYTEVIGLLGGRYRSGRLTIETAFPCQSTSTTTECEMDPRSEVSARDEFSQCGLTTVGWYHSHPLFDALPSVRDLDNQHSYQRLCIDSSPFVGFIVSPHHGFVSDIMAFYVDQNMPYRMPAEVISRGRMGGVIGEMVKLLEAHSRMLHRADLSKRFRRKEVVTVWEKLAISLRSHWSEDVRQKWDDDVAALLRPLIKRHFSGSD
ncbi:hypothetical protein BX070DRAFT_237412 [Coemansia spiralis]|nr:hypothetical protein BX070DRAFT_237412 [Coemansia spiralis]